MKRFLAAVLMVMSAAACGVVIDSGQESGPEQFVFEIRPGSGPGDQAERLVAGLMVQGATLMSADSVVWVQTPVGRVDVVDSIEVIDGSEHHCRALIAQSFGSQACGDGFAQVPASQIEIDGSSSHGEWTFVEVRVGDGVTALRAQADDGAVYRAGAVRGVAIFVYPGNRGSLTVQGLGPDGEPVGVAVTAG